MITDNDLAQACTDVYSELSENMQQTIVQGIVFGMRTTEDAVIIAFRGSKFPGDWADDFRAIPKYISGFGTVHSGFYDGLPNVLSNLSIVLRHEKRKIYVTGHSLGAARAWLFGAMLADTITVPKAIVAFAPPRPGLLDFREHLCLTGAELRGYHNSGDVVPDVPVFPFIHPVELKSIKVAPAVGESGIFRYHHIGLYMKGLIP